MWLTSRSKDRGHARVKVGKLSVVGWLLRRNICEASGRLEETALGSLP